MGAHFCKLDLASSGKIHFILFYKTSSCNSQSTLHISLRSNYFETKHSARIVFLSLIYNNPHCVDRMELLKLSFDLTRRCPLFRSTIGLCSPRVEIHG